MNLVLRVRCKSSRESSIKCSVCSNKPQKPTDQLFQKVFSANQSTPRTYHAIIKREIKIPICKILFCLVVFCICACDQNHPAKNNPRKGKDTLLSNRGNDKLSIKISSGKVYAVENRLQDLTAYKDGKLLWTTDIGKQFTSPVPGKNEIRYIRLDQGDIFVVYGNHCYIRVDTAKGTITDLECD